MKAQRGTHASMQERGQGNMAMNVQ